MKRSRILVGWIFLLLILLLANGGQTSGIVQAQDRSSPPVNLRPGWPYDPHHVLVKFEPGARSPLMQRVGVQHLLGDWYLIPTPPDQDVLQWMATVAQEDQVAFVEPDYLFRLGDFEPQPGVMTPQSHQVYPNDPYYRYQWHMPMVQSDAAWALTRGAHVVVAVVDSGVTRGTDLQCRTFVSPFNAITDIQGETAVRDDEGHGTHVTGTIAQCTDNNLGVVGLAPEVDIMPVKVLGANGEGSFSDVGQGIRWAVDHGADVINLSLGADCQNQTFEDGCHDPYVDDALVYAASHDVVVVAAAGNKARSTPGYPANHPDVIAVSAVTMQEQLAYYSDHGSKISVAAPGGDVRRDTNHDRVADGVIQQTFNQYGVWDYYPFQGTSMASPHVAAAAALLRAYVPQANRMQVQQALEQTAKDLGASGKDNFYGYGLIQVADALTYLKNHMATATPTPTPTPTATPRRTSTPTATATSPAGARRLWLPLQLKSPPGVPTPTRTPTVTPTPPSGGHGDIYGRITVNNQAPPEVLVVLQAYAPSGGNEELVSVTTTDAQGNYHFRNVPSLPAGKLYHVVYGPNLFDSRFVRMWYGPDITSYQAGQTLPGGDFDIANVVLTNPPADASRALPVTFTWQKRAYAQDTYTFVLTDGSRIWFVDLGNVGQYTMQSLPSGAAYHQTYYWYPMIKNGEDSYGIPYEARAITFLPGE